MERPIEQAPGRAIADDGAAAGDLRPDDLALQIDELGAVLRQALTRRLAPDEERAVAELVECLRELLGEDVDE